MKKLIALFLAIIMMAAVAATAEGPSASGGDMNYSTTDTFVFAVSDDEALLAKSNAELEKLKAAEKPADYFGLADEIANILGDADVTIAEFWPVIAANYEESMGPQVIGLSFATPYEEGQTVAVLIGFYQPDDTVAWLAFRGEGQPDKSIKFELDPKTILDVQANTALLAVASK